jgi:carbonic anhydrase/acetyltransferase-like protein (isoleucine patch superfamily)
MPLYSLDGVAPVLPGSGRFWVAPDANVIGKVSLGEDSGIWFGATLRGDNEWIVVGARTNIQEMCILHTDMGFPLDIGPGCTIGHGAILHGCTIGPNCLIGMGAVVLNGARIGANCVVGAHALVTEGKQFGEASLIVGSPARAVRSLDEAAVAGLEAAATHYVARARRFAEGLKRLDA